MKRAFWIISFCLVFSAAVSYSQPVEDAVSFTIPLDKTIFSESAIIRVVIWNEKELAKAKSGDECMVSFDMKTRQEKTVCPDGQVYEKPEPTEFSFPVGDIEGDLKIAATYVRVEEHYKVQVSGKSKDNCNTASASAEGQAEEKLVTLAPLSYAVTEMACVP